MTAMNDAASNLSSRPIVMFDFDGTLANTKPAIVATAEKVLADWGLTPEQIGDAGRLVGPPFPQAFTLVYGFSAEDAAEVTRRYRAIYTNLGIETFPLFDGMEQILERLHDAGRTVTVTTSKQEWLAKRMLGQLGIDGLVDLVVGQTDQATSDKTSLISRTLRELDATPQQAVMVGDRFYDIDGAHACDVPCVAVQFGTATREELEGAGAEAICETPEQLTAVLLG